MKSKYIKGFFTGTMIGVAAGMLLLPQVSSETRRKIISKGKDLVQNYSRNTIEDQE